VCDCVVVSTEECDGRRATSVVHGSIVQIDHSELGPLMVARAGGLLARRRLMDSVECLTCAEAPMAHGSAVCVCSSSRASIERSSKRPKKVHSGSVQGVRLLLFMEHRAWPIL
jgi:hypothetical protein